MTNDDLLLKEVDEGLAEDDIRNTIEKRGPVILAAAAAIVAGVAGFQFYSASQDAEAADAARQYYSVTEDEDAAAADRIAGLKLFLTDAPAGYGALANFQIAAEASALGNSDEAKAAYDKIVNDGALPKRIKDLARVRSAYLALDDGRDAVIAAVGDLEAEDSALGFYAREALAFAALKDGDYQTAASLFDAASIALTAPRSVRSRAEQFAAMARAAAVGDGLTWLEPISSSDIIKQIGDDLSTVLQADGPSETDAGQEDVSATTEEISSDGGEGTSEETVAPAADGQEMSADDSMDNETAGGESAGTEDNDQPDETAKDNE